MAQEIHDMEYDEDGGSWVERVTLPMDYHLQHSPAKNYQRVLWRDGYTLQGQELNEVQEILSGRISGIGNALFADGDIIKDAQIIVNPETGEVRAQSGLVYLQGAVRRVPEGSLVISPNGIVSVGLYLRNVVVSELEDQSLRNPANATGADEPGAWRLWQLVYWGFAGDGNKGDFFPVHTVEDGAVRAKEPPPSLDAWNQSIARYDRDSTSGGSYVARGLIVRAAGHAATGEQMYTISEGRARVNGWGVEFPTSKRIKYAAEPDLRAIGMEVYQAQGSGRQRVTVAHPPIQEVTRLTVTRQKTVSVRHGSYSGCADVLPDTGVVEIVQCRQGETVYEQSVDYIKNGDLVDWSPGGNEMQTGSTYECTYKYLAQAVPEELDREGFSVSDAVAGTSIMITYTQALPRIDRLCLMQDGGCTWVKGVPAEYNPRTPEIPAGTLPLATVRQTWKAEPTIKNDSPRSMSFEEIQALYDHVDYVLREMARTRLESDISTREAGAKAGIYVDPLQDDNNRDQGIPQTGAVFDGQLCLAIDALFHPLEHPGATPYVPPYSPEVVVEQTLRTGAMLINEYMNFDTLPAKITLNPATDFWTDVDTTWASPITHSFGTGNIASGTTSTETLSSSTTNLEYLRERDIAFTATGFGAGEILDKVIFDGIEVDTDPLNIKANDAGVAAGKFAIPPKIPAGAKTVAFHGKGGSYGTASFVGQGKLTVQTLRQVSTKIWRTFINVDPLCQTMTLPADRMVCGLDIWFQTRNTEVRIQAREMENGQPTNSILAEGSVQPENIVITGNGHTRIPYEIPFFRQKDAEFGAVAMCNDPTTSVWIAEGGKFDSFQQKWVSAQPYTVGVLLSSSNASTWTAHQNIDLAFRLLACKFAPGPHEIVMGAVEVADATDLVLFVVDETPTAETRVEYELTMPDSTVVTVAAGQPIRFATPVTGAITVKARLYGSEYFMPLVYPHAQLAVGTIRSEGDYYSRSIPTIDANRAILIYDAFIPSGATVTPEMQVDMGEWQGMGQATTVRQDNGIIEYHYNKPLSNATEAKVRFTLTGTAAARPTVHNIRFMAVK